MMQGMSHVQDHNITHLDVKFDNFFIDKDGGVKVADFGLSKTEAQFHAQTTDRGDLPLFLAPELNNNHLKLYNGGRAISNKVDVWSVGVMAHKMFEGQYPIDGRFMSAVENKLAQLDQQAQSGATTDFIPDPKTPEQHFLNRILKADPQQRENFQALMKDAIFDELFVVQNGQRGDIKPEVKQLLKRELDNKVVH